MKNLKTTNQFAILTVAEATSQIDKIHEDVREEFCNGIMVRDERAERDVIDKTNRMKTRAFVRIVIASILAGYGFIPLKLIPFAIKKIRGGFRKTTTRVIELVTEWPAGKRTRDVGGSDIWDVLHAEYKEQFKAQGHFFVSEVMKGLSDENGLPPSLSWMTVGEKELLLEKLKNVEYKAAVHSVDITDKRNPVSFDSEIQTTAYLSAYASEIGEKYQPLVDEWNKFGEEMLEMCRQVSYGRSYVRGCQFSTVKLNFNI